MRKDVQRANFLHLLLTISSNMHLKMIYTFAYKVVWLADDDNLSMSEVLKLLFQFLF